MAKSIAVQELEGPLEQAQEAAEDAKDDVANHAADAALAAGLAAGDGAELAQELDNGNEQAAEADGAETVRQGAAGGTAGGALGKVVNAKVPGAVDTRDGGVDGVFEPLGDPVHGKGDVDHEADELGLAAAAAVGAAVWIARRGLVLDVEGDHGDGEPGGKSRGDEPANEADEVDVAILFADIDGRLEHQGGKGDAGDPRVKGKGGEAGKDEEDDAGGPVSLVEVVDGSAKGPADVEDARDPDELLGKGARHPDVGPGEDKGDDEDAGEEDDGVAVEGKVVAGLLVDAGAGAAGDVAADGDGGDDDEAGKGGEELGPSAMGEARPRGGARRTRRPAHQSLYFGFSTLKASSKPYFSSFAWGGLKL